VAVPSRRAVLREALDAVGSRLATAGIWHCLAYGTLLGAVREGDVIEWDHDIDLIVRPCDREQLLAAAPPGDDVEFVQSVITGPLTLRPGGPGGVALTAAPALTIRFRGALVGELWAPLLFADGVLRLHDLSSETVLWPHAAVPAFVYDELREIESRGCRYPVPLHAETVLEWDYGVDWRVPIRAQVDDGRHRAGRGISGEDVEPKLAHQVAWCEGQGWDRSRYAGLPAWPRALSGVGALGHRSSRWLTVDEVGEYY